MSMVDRITRRSASMLASASQTAKRLLAPSPSEQYAMAALAGCAVFGFAALSQPVASGPIASAPMETAVEVSFEPVSEAAAAVPAQPHEVAPAPIPSAGPAPVRAEPVSGAPMLEYDVAYYWPKSPQTVTTSTQVRSRPDRGARILHVANPGERLRINGRIEVGRTEWLRVRLAKGGDGYLSADTVALANYRRPRPTPRPSSPSDEQSIELAVTSSTVTPAAEEPLPLF